MIHSDENQNLYDIAIIGLNGRLTDIDLFDRGFFGFFRREAEILNPQYRLFLECAHEVLEKVGYAPEHYAGRIGVYVGASENGYFSGFDENDQLGLDDFQVMLGNRKDFLATLVAYKLNLTGAALTVQTTCLADGLEEGVLAVIKGSAINNDGALKVGFTAPSLEGEAQVITDA